jgi:hypothetical protein
MADARRSGAGQGVLTHAADPLGRAARALLVSYTAQMQRVRMTHIPAVTAVLRDPPSGSGGNRGLAFRDFRWPAAVAATYTLAQPALFYPGTALGRDERVYVSQVTRGAEAAFFSAPRARGITLLVAPVTVLTSSVDVLRVYLAVLSGAGLFLVRWVWRSLLSQRVLALAGGLFAGLWITLFYGPQVMPKL